MAERDEYTPILKALDAAGYFYSLRDYRGHGYQLVCVSNRSAAGRLHGRSFWLCKSSAQEWFVMTWGGDTAFIIGDESLVAEVCVACLRHMREDKRIPDRIVEKYGLQPVDASRVRGFDIAPG
ncbi:MAG TPA: hypothetical protein VMS17_05105 [Gemmataceae bacterium]|nr:hypothetical protein [Gemmataceae bacterium]